MTTLIDDLVRDELWLRLTSLAPHLGQIQTAGGARLQAGRPTDR